MIDLSVVIVSWNVSNLLRVCLRSVYDELASVAERRSFTAEVIVVDNASGDDTVAMVTGEFPLATLIANEENVGFTRGNNQALRQANGRYLWLLNPDCEVQPEALTAMLDYMGEHSEVGCVGPKLLFPDGSVQSSRRRFPSLRTGLVESTVLQRWLGNSRLIRDYYCGDRPDDITQEVDWLVGACLLIRRETLDQAGLLDEDYFMYSEELDWCYRAKHLGWKMVYLPQACVVHHEGKSSEQNLARRDIHFNESKCLFFAKHHGALQATVLRVFIFLTFLYRIVEESLKFVLVKRNRPMRRNRLAMLVQVSRYQFRGLLGGKR